MTNTIIRPLWGHVGYDPDTDCQPPIGSQFDHTSDEIIQSQTAITVQDIYRENGALQRNERLSNSVAAVYRNRSNERQSGYYRVQQM